MALRKRYRQFFWRLFIPTLALVWVIVLLLMGYSYQHETSYREQNIRKQLSLFNSRVLYAYSNGIEIQSFLNSLKYFFDDSNFDNIRVSVFTKEDYESSNQPTYFIGKPIDKDYIIEQTGEDLTDEGTPDETFDPKTTYYYKGVKSNDGQIYVYTAMPYSVSIAESLRANDVSFWILLSIVLASTLVITYLVSNSLTRNVRTLRKFATDANSLTETANFDESQFTHDELGEISREIVKISRERAEAIKKSQREHDIAIHAIEEKARIKRQLTNNINHELKTPVGVIKGYLDTVLSAPDMDESTRNYFLKRAQENTDRLCNLLSDVSTMTRLEEGSTNIPIQNLDFHDLVFGIDNDFQTSGVTKNMTFEYDIPLDCEVRGNNGLLTSAISNLMKNAALHSHGTEMGLKLVAESKKYFTFSFWDNGTGVPTEHIAHIFDRFYRVDSGRSRKSGGTGLGLPIVKNIIEALGGSISVHNRSTGGLEFLFTLEKAK